MQSHFSPNDSSDDLDQPFCVREGFDAWRFEGGGANPRPHRIISRDDRKPVIAATADHRTVAAAACSGNPNVASDVTASGIKTEAMEQTISREVRFLGAPQSIADARAASNAKRSLM